MAAVVSAQPKFLYMVLYRSRMGWVAYGSPVTHFADLDACVWDGAERLPVLGGKLDRVVSKDPSLILES